MLLLIFLIDLYAPFEIAIGILYILCFFLICNQNKMTIVGFATALFLLAITKFMIFYNPDTSYIIYFNRMLTVSTIIIIALLSLRYRTMVESRNADRVNYEKQIEEMLFITSHKVRKPLANCFGLLNLFESEQAMTAAEQNHIINHLKSSASELDTFTKELTIFMGDIKRNKPNIE